MRYYFNFFDVAVFRSPPPPPSAPLQMQTSSHISPTIFQLADGALIAVMHSTSTWGSTYSSNLKRILLLQKKVVRIISGSAFDAHTEPIFKQLKVLKLCDIFRFQVGKIVFLFKKRRLPIAFNNLFMIRSQLHSYNTRNSSSFYTFSCRTNIRQFAIRTQGPRLFNSLNSEICNAANISLFKSKLKTFLLN